MLLNMGVQKKYKAGFEVNGSIKTSSRQLGVFGPSGSGKTTLMKLLAGWETPDAGNITVNNQVIVDIKRIINRKPEERRIATVFQHAALFSHLNVEQNLLYGFKRQHATNDIKLVGKCVETLRLNSILKRKTNYLSGGEKQRVAIGRAVLALPQILILDEPLTGLDRKMKIDIAGYLKTLCAEQNIPYIFISHSVFEMQIMTNEVVVIEDGQIAPGEDTVDWMKKEMFKASQGYINFLEIISNGKKDGMHCYSWEGTKIVAMNNADKLMVIARLSSRDIMLFKNHPKAISARNLFKCKVRSIWNRNERVGVELFIDNKILIAEVVEAAAKEMKLKSGSSVYAAIKASAIQIA